MKSIISFLSIALAIILIVSCTNLNTEKNQEYIRSKAVDLLALLESNTIDYLFLYKSVAEQHNLKYILLPDSINLKNPELKEYYKNAKVDISWKTPKTTITKEGQVIVYGISVLKNAPNKKTALKFVNFVLSEKGKHIMEENGQPANLKTDDKYLEIIPEILKPHFE